MLGRWLGTLADKRGVVAVAKSKKVEVARWTQPIIEPRDHQQRAFEHEPLALCREAQTIEEPCEDEAREQELKGSPSLA